MGNISDKGGSAETSGLALVVTPFLRSARAKIMGEAEHSHEKFILSASQTLELYFKDDAMGEPNARPPTRRNADSAKRPDYACISPEDSQAEAVGLARAIALDVRAEQLVPLSRYTPSMLLTKGHSEMLAEVVKENDIDVVIVNHALTPIQQRNLEKALQAKVLDRTALILEIFGARAETKEGKLQVELAALSYQRSRLVRSWTHLERQRGGFGFLGGPGESQLEMDRRIITDRITRIKLDLEKVKQNRGIQRYARQKVPYPVVAFVGYTNAGKSTLFNALTGADVFAEDMPFATLDPTLRVVDLPSRRKVILVDTVGFISDLPTQLIAAFRATLEEVVQADVLLLVQDASSPLMLPQLYDVIATLEGLGIDMSAKICIHVLNKIDAILESEDIPSTLAIKKIRHHPKVHISALDGQGLPELIRMLDSLLSQFHVSCTISIPVTDGAAIAWIKGRALVTMETLTDEKLFLSCVLDEAELTRFEKLYGYSMVRDNNLSDAGCDADKD